MGDQLFVLKIDQLFSNTCKIPKILIGTVFYVAGPNVSGFNPISNDLFIYFGLHWHGWLFCHFFFNR